MMLFKTVDAQSIKLCVKRQTCALVSPATNKLLIDSFFVPVTDVFPVDYLEREWLCLLAFDVDTKGTVYETVDP